MSRKISYKGQLPMGQQDRIKLATIKGKVGYKINKFQIISNTPGGSNAEFVGQITKTDQTGSISAAVDFTNSELLAVAYLADRTTNEGSMETIIFDNEKFNQDIFINITDTTGGTTPCNYYIELETMSLSDLESTMLTLKNLRTITN